VPFAEITTTGKVVLLLVAGTFIVLSLVVAMVVPRRRPTFPGRRVGLFTALAVALFAVQLATVWWVAETQEVEAAEHGEPAETETGPGETETTPSETETRPGETETAPGETETAPGETETAPGETETEPAETETTPSQGGDAAAGKAVFASAGCGSCHTLADAGTSGTIGPNLDQMKPSFDKAVETVTEGKAPMPSFKGQLSEEQIRDVAAYVSESTRGP
jgi:mono/diheme cytochrome c family protein